MRYVLILSTARIRVCKYGQRDRDVGFCVKKFTHAGLYKYISASRAGLSAPLAQVNA